MMGSFFSCRFFSLRHAGLFLTLLLVFPSCSNLFEELNPDRVELSQDVKDAAAAVEISFPEGEDSTGVTGDLVLPTAGDFGTDITWESSEEDLINPATGTVAQPFPDDGRLAGGTAEVTLTAVVEKDGARQKAVFTAQGEALPPAEADAQLLELGLADGDEAGHVTQDITLPAGTDAGDYDSDISWTTSNNSIINNTGTVTRPGFVSPDNEPVPVTLTAEVSDGGQTVTKEFTVQVARNDPTDAEAVAADGTLLENHFTDTYGPADGGGNLPITEDLDLFDGGKYDTTISWTSTNAAIDAATGEVARPAPGEEDAVGTLTAEITRNGQTETVTINTVVPALAETEVLEADKALLAIGYAPGDDVYSVTGNLTLDDGTEAQYYGSEITWSSSDNVIIADDGAVTRPAFQSPDNPKAPITLTATLTYDGETAEKAFDVKVLREEPTDQEAAAAAADLLQPEGPDQVPDNILAPADSPEDVGEDLTLPGTGEYGTTITWSSDDTGTIGNDGTVTLPGPGEGDQTVTLTGTISRNDGSGGTETITFTVTVLEPAADLTVTIDMTDPANPVDSLGGTQPTLNQAAQGGAEVMTVNATEGMDSYTWTLSDGSATYSDTYPNGTTPFNGGSASQTVDSALLTVGTAYTLELWYETGGSWYAADFTFSVVYDEEAN